ncbi:MAG: endo-beta-N-acetylglucosaminidase [Clostridiales bacterium]|nr:endo-beta-N-acetylglucosaminidase [Clostridiales bacterium]
MRKSKNLPRKSISVLCAAAVVASSLAVAPAAFAEVNGDGTIAINEKYVSHESLQPTPQAFQVDTLLKWTPESDPDAKFARSTVELVTDRVTGPLVNQYANPDAKLMVCSLANSNHDNSYLQGSDTFDSYAFGYWQYVNSMVYWAGSDEGIFVIPTPDVIDSAHKNGVPVTATLGFPWGPDSTGGLRLEELRKFVQKDANGNYPVADKMVEIARYYGFDGYFFNQETYGSTSQVAREMANMMKYVKKKYPDMMFNWYDSMVESGGVSYQDAVTEANKLWIERDEEGYYAVDEFFMNYNWGASQIATTISTMNKYGRSQYDAFAGFEVQQNSFNTVIRDHLLVDGNGKLKLSIALYCPNSTMGFAKDPADFHEQEKRFYVGSAGDPTNEPLDPTNPSNSQWVGMARFFADKTVITEAPFTTNFNTGHGSQWFVDGEVSRTEGWNNRSAQDILPTWTWTVQSQGGKLQGAYDFNDAYNGGNSVKFAGDLDAANKIMLYSTQVENAKSASVTYKVNKDGSNVQLGLCYGDNYDEANFKYYDLGSGTAGEWTTANVDVSADAGKGQPITAIAIKVDGQVTDYQLNLGNISLSDTAAQTCSAPKTATLDEILYKDANKAQARIYWDGVDNAAYYELYQVKADGSTQMITALTNTAYYMENLTKEAGQDTATVRIVPVNADGVRGEYKDLVIDWELPEEATAYAPIPSSPNVCLNEVSAVVTGYSGQGAAEPAWKAIDGTSLNGSKWCQASTNRGWMTIKLVDGPKTIRRWRVEHAEAGGEGKINNTRDFSLQYKDAAGNWQIAKSISGNTEAVTDVVLDQPITAEEWKLNITYADAGLWTAIRIYEWQMFEDGTLPPADTVGMQFASAQNNSGATDTFSLSHVPAGSTVRAYADLNKENLLGSAVAGNDGKVVLENLNFGAGAGRVYYTVQGGITGESDVLSTSYESENAQKTPAATDVSFTKFNAIGSETDSRFKENVYTSLTVNGLQEGDVVYLYEKNADPDNLTAGLHTKKSLPVAAGQTSVTIDRVQLPYEGTGLTMQVKRNGMMISDKYEVSALTALNNLLAEAEAVTKADYPIGYAELQKAIAAAQAVAGNENANFDEIAAQVEAMTNALSNVKAVTEVLQTIVNNAEKIKAEGALDNTLEVIVNGFNTSLENAKALLENPKATQSELNAAAADLLGWVAKVDWKQGDKTALQVAVDVATSINENINLYLDTEAFIAAFENAKAVLASGNSMQDDVDDAYNALMDAMLNLKMAANKDILNDLIAQVSGMNLSGYTADSVKALNNALAQAKKVAADVNAIQATVDEAAANLAAAQAGLVKETTDNPSVELPVVTPGNNGQTGGNVQNTGDGSTPTQTGDAGSFGFLALTVLAGAAAVVFSRKKRD